MRGPRRPVRWERVAQRPAGGARLSGPACVVGGSVALQGAAALATTAFAALGAVGTAGLRFSAAAAVLLAVTRPSARGRPWGAIAAFGAAMAGATLCLFSALERVPLGTAVTLQFVGPLALALAGSRRPRDLAAAAAAGAGVLLLTGGPAGGDAAGLALALAAGACVAATVLAAERTGGIGDLALAVGVAALLTLPLAAGAAAAGDPGALAAAAAAGVLGVALPYTLFRVALARAGRRTYGILLSLDPAVAALAGAALLGQGAGPGTLAGIALVMAASAGAVATRRPGGR